jgi:hypothetical protein
MKCLWVKRKPAVAVPRPYVVVWPRMSRSVAPHLGEARCVYQIGLNSQDAFNRQTRHQAVRVCSMGDAGPRSSKVTCAMGAINFTYLPLSPSTGENDEKCIPLTQSVLLRLEGPCALPVSHSYDAAVTSDGKQASPFLLRVFPRVS